MCSTIDETYEQEAIRSIDTLLKLETYQGMTDAEIESLIQYRVDAAIRDYSFTEVEIARAATMQQINNTNAEGIATMLSMVQSLQRDIEQYRTAIEPVYVNPVRIGGE